MDAPTGSGDPTVYNNNNFMFGPDKCGYNKRTHLISDYKGKNVLKKSDPDYKQEDNGTSHLYTMILKPDAVRDMRSRWRAHTQAQMQALEPWKVKAYEKKKMRSLSTPCERGS